MSLCCLLPLSVSLYEFMDEVFRNKMLLRQCCIRIVHTYEVFLHDVTAAIKPHLKPCQVPLTSVGNMAPFLSEQQKRFVLGAAAALLLQAGHEIKKKKRKKRKWWVRPWSSDPGDFFV